MEDAGHVAGTTTGIQGVRADEPRTSVVPSKIGHSVHFVPTRTQRVRGHQGRLAIRERNAAGGLGLHCGMLWPRPARPRLSAGQGTALTGRSDATQQCTQQ